MIEPIVARRPDFQHPGLSAKQATTIDKISRAPPPWTGVQRRFFHAFDVVEVKRGDKSQFPAGLLAALG
jgi:hypothetical protein